MAAFTTFSDESLERYLIMFGRGTLIEHSAIKGGIENSNYFVHLEQHGEVTEFVLTIMEDHGFDEVPFFSKILTRLHHYGLPVAAPQTTLDGMTSTIFCGKPTFLFKRLPGTHLEDADEDHCRSLGAFIASSHHALGSMEETRDNPYCADWMDTTLSSARERISMEDRELLNRIIRCYRDLTSSELPRGLIHGDLFRDNALFVDGKLTGVIDFYHACHDLLVLDLAVALNDWCLDDNGEIDPARKRAMIEGYETVRTLSPAEQDALLTLQQVSAARFALTRLLSGNPPLKNPAEMIALARKLDQDR